MLDRYRLQRRLGAGGFGTVWMARDERLERDVAVKIVPRERIVGGRFEREARAAARLSHPGIVTLYEAAVDDDGAYLVSELVRGAHARRSCSRRAGSRTATSSRSRSRCATRSRTPTRRASSTATSSPRTCSSPSDRPAPAIAKLTDFGVARVIGGDSLTRTGDVVGTAAYMAPEQAEGLRGRRPGRSLLARARHLRGADRRQPGAHRAPRASAPAVSAPICRRCAASAATCPRSSDARSTLRCDRGRASAGRSRSCIGALARGRASEVADTPGVVTGAWRGAPGSKASMPSPRALRAAPPPERSAARARSRPGPGESTTRSTAAISRPARDRSAALAGGRDGGLARRARARPDRRSPRLPSVSWPRC